ncbi:hypothetical protein ACFXPA_41200 [Amycolatopsis sp. NPDC059090]|uniref:hypothetical protein n=1 Tax=unclassified Amycolatopsis TaxID=2618356 RepID=UPI00366BA4AB
MALTGNDIYNQIHNPGDTTGLDAMGGGCGDLKSIHNEVATKLTESQAALNSFWKGQAAETGKAGLAPLITTSHLAAEKMDSMQKSIAEQSAAFNYVKNAVVPVAASRPDDQKLTDYVSLGASDDEIAAAEFDDKTKKNVEAYGQYQLSTDPRTQTMPMDYPAAHDPNVSSGGITPDQPAPGTGGRVGSGAGHHSSGGGSSHNYGGGPSHSYSSGPSTYSAPPGAAGMPVPPPPGHGGPVAPPVSPPNDSTRAAWADPTPPPPSQAWQPPSGLPGGGNTGNGGMNGAFGPVGGLGGFGPTSGGGGGFGPGGSGAGSGGAGGPGAGPRGVGGGTGAGALGESAGRPAMGGGAGAAGAKGQPGMGGMGGGGKGGKGPEDEEHQRKILLAEEDPDSIFGGYDGNRPTPPVIGA